MQEHFPVYKNFPLFTPTQAQMEKLLARDSLEKIIIESSSSALQSEIFTKRIFQWGEHCENVKMWKTSNQMKMCFPQNPVFL